MFVASKLGAKKVESGNSTHLLAQPPCPVGSFEHPPLNIHTLRSTYGAILMERVGNIENGYFVRHNF
jgi:hypothetical protein